MADFLRNVLTIPAAVVGLIILLLIARALRRSSARRAEAARQAQLQQEGRDRQEKNRIEKEESEKRIQAAIKKRADEIDAAISACPGSEKYRLSAQQTESNVKTLNITEFTPISKKRYVAFDFETTGVRYTEDKIVEIGAVLVENGEVVKEYHQMVDPECPMPADASAVNHITDDMLADQPKIHQVLPAFLSFVGDDVLVAHNAPFDIRFLCQACMVHRFRTPAVCFDTMTLARYWPESNDRKLTSLIAAAGIENDDAHRALSDARAVAALVSATNKRRSESKHKKES